MGIQIPILKSKTKEFSIQVRTTIQHGSAYHFRLLLWIQCSQCLGQHQDRTLPLLDELVLQGAYVLPHHVPSNARMGLRQDKVSILHQELHVFQRVHCEVYGVDQGGHLAALDLIVVLTTDLHTHNIPNT